MGSGIRGKKVSKSTMRRELQKMNFSYITPRARHYKQDKAKVDAFKKKINLELKKTDYDEVLFFDEARFGTHTKIGYGWFKKGERTPVEVKIGYKAFYVYSAVSAKNGSNLIIKFPSVDTICMNVFLSELSKKYENSKIAFIMDGAGWHKSKDLKVPENIDVFLLPPYSPELNPVERFWRYLKENVLHNKLFNTLEEIEESLQSFISSLENHIVAQICNNNYLDI